MSMKLLAKKAETIEFREAIVAIKICIGKSLNLSRGKRLNLNLAVQNMTNNRNMRTGGYEQNRADRSYDYQFSKNSYYYYANAINAFLNIGLRF